MRPTQSEQILKSNLFTDPNDLYAVHPDIGGHIEEAAHELVQAHRHTGALEIGGCLARAEAATLRANAAFASVLGPGADSAKLLVLVRLAVEALAHRGAVAPMQGQQRHGDDEAEGSGR